MFKALLQLVRFPNLLIVALTQYILRYCILMPPLKLEGLEPVLSSLQFFILVFSTMLIAAGGYVINDIADLEIDRLNKPEKMVVGKYFSPKQSLWIYHSINLLGFSISLLLAWQIDHIRLIFLFPIAVVLLWLYSYYLKKMLLTGNMVVGLFCAFVAIIVLFAERDVFYGMSPENTSRVLLLFLGYGMFAYLSTMYREIVKDIEDIEGDLKNDCQTLPIVMGTAKAKLIAGFFALSMVFCLAYASVFLWKIGHLIELFFLLLGIIAPTFYSLFRLRQAQTKTDFHHISQVIKLIMLAGILYVPLYWWLTYA